jgi:flagellar L-ring protein precursor FlgH
VTGPFNFISPTDLNASGAQSFTGKGDAAQSNALTGEIAVVVVGVRPNGVLEVKGDKLFRLNRGDERIELTGLVRPSDIGADNRVFSPRLADARISYVGKGEIARASQQGWLQRFFARISPF